MELIRPSAKIWEQDTSFPVEGNVCYCYLKDKINLNNEKKL